jgi:hypothetical protein
MSNSALRETELGFRICAPRALEIRSRFSFWFTKMRFRKPGWGTTSGVLPVPSGIRHSGVGGATTGAPKCTRFRPSRIQHTTETRSRTPLSLALLGKHPSNDHAQLSSYLRPPDRRVQHARLLKSTSERSGGPRPSGGPMWRTTHMCMCTYAPHVQTAHAACSHARARASPPPTGDDTGGRI